MITGTASADHIGVLQHHRPSNLRDVGLAHGIIMLLAFGVLFPFGSCLLRALNSPRVARLHAYWQSVSWALAIAGFSMGVYIAKEGG
jgi:hypothetical protein